ncbi:hypothetical protein F5Y01DRAFT_296960 [Xylaria sp. FL0043]|nr:hypothetical protein F5Y01DRAFT_296960 [Xylaria sp. FL0043]
MNNRHHTVIHPYLYDLDDFPPLKAMFDVEDPSEPASSTTFSDKNAADTPTHSTKFESTIHERTTSSSSMSFTINGMCEVPEHGCVYMIRDVDSEKAITLVEGRLTLTLATGNTRGGWQWICEELDHGWIGFREVVSGRLLGRDNKGGFYVQATRLRDWESFVLRPREVGGYNLQVRYGDRLRAMAIADDGEAAKLVEISTAKEAARWEFVRVE